MSRTKAELREIIKTRFVQDSQMIGLYGLVPGQTFDQQFSTASLEMIWIENLINSIFEHEQIVSTNAENSRPHNISWYREKVLSYLDGLPLTWLNGQFDYDLTDVDDVADRSIIKRCAVLESDDGELVIKIAGIDAPLLPEQLERFVTYMQQIKDAGNILRIINDPADLLKISLSVYVDPQLIDLSTGAQLNTDDDIKPVEVAINNYLANLEFNGAFVKQFFREAINDAIGVHNTVLDIAEWKFAAFPFAAFGEWKVSEAGYFKIEPSDLIITYLNWYEVANS